MADETNEDKVKIPNFAYPFKRKSNSSTKTKSDQEIFEELLFQEQDTQYLFNKSGLWHGGVHLIAERFDMDFKVEGISAIADGKVIAYKLDSEYLKNEVAGKTVLYSSSFMLLEHEMAYPASNKLRFYSLYMHMAPKSQYTLTYELTDLVYKIVGIPKYARNKVDRTEAKDSNGNALVHKGDYVVVEEEPSNSKKNVKVLKVNEKSIPEDITVYIKNLEKVEVVTVTVKGDEANLRPNFNGPPAKLNPEELLAEGTEIVIDKKVGKNGRHKVFRVGDVDRTDHVSIYKTDFNAPTASKGNGIITKDMNTDSFEPLSTPIEVKAGDVLGKLGLYNNEWREEEKDKLVHLEVFIAEPIDTLKTFIGNVETEYARDVNTLSDEEKKVRPKENRIYVPSKRKDESIVRYIKEDYVYAKLTEADWLRDKTVRNPANDRTFNVLKVDGVKQKIKNNAIIKINPTKNGNRYNVISVEEGDDDVQSVISEETVEKWSVWHESIEIHHKFYKLPKEAEEFYLTIFEPFTSDKILKDKDAEEYQEVTNLYGTTIYVKKDKVVKTHGITFSNFELIDKDATSSVKAGIFEDMEAFKDPESTKTQQEKEKLNKLFADILEKIKVDKDKSGGLEAGELAGLSLTPPKRDELSHLIVEHKSEWSTDNEERKKVMLLQKKLADKMEEGDAKTTAQDEAKMTDERIETLSFFEASNPDFTFIHPIALVEGFVGSSCYCGRDFTVDEVKKIVQELRDNELDEHGVAVVKRAAGYRLFTFSRCKIPEEDKTYERFTEELNKMMTKYKINTCIRKIHFLAQSYHESDRFRTTKEGTSRFTRGYDPYRGRGLLQITHSGSAVGTAGYKQYFQYLGRTDYAEKYELLNEDLSVALDASGYFWFRGKILSRGTSLRSKYANSKGIKKLFSKKRVTNPTLTTIDLNQVADDDNIEELTYLVNGAQRGLSERREYTNKLKEVFKYEDCKNKK